MSGNITIWLCLPDSTRVALLDMIETARWSRIINGVGWFDISLPDSFDESLITIDGIVEIWRTPLNGASMLDFAGFIRVVTITTDNSGVTHILIAGPDINEVVRRRIIAYYAGSTYSTKTDNSDDLLKDWMRENIGTSATDTDRLLSYITISQDETLGASLTFSAAWDDLEGAIADLLNAASQGTPIYWAIIPSGNGVFTFRTFINQPGADHTQSSGNPVVFGLAFGNLSIPQLVRDYSREITYVYAGGQGTGAGRTIVEVEDTARSSRSIWGRREAFYNGSGETTTPALTSKANAMLTAGEPKEQFRATLLDTPQAVYGIDWGLGDRVVVAYRNKQYDALVKAVKSGIDNTGLLSTEGYCEVTI